MRLAIICRPFAFHGGVETATAGLLRELAGSGYGVDLLSTHGQEEVAGIRLRRLPVLRHPSALRLLSFGLAARRAVLAGSYDVVQSHERVLLQDIYRAGEGCHGAYLRAAGRRWVRANPYHRLVLSLEKRIFSLETARHIVAISAAGKREICRLFGTPPERVSVVYNGVDLERFHPDNRRRWRGPIRAELGLGESDWMILFVGSGFERKGLGPLIGGLGRLGDPAARLVVAGKGRREPYLALTRRLGLDGRVLWLGPRQDVERLYGAADVVALPALYEPFGNVHLEALAAGVPVLTSSRAGGAEVITSGVNGWVVQEPEPGPIAEGLGALRPDGPARPGEAARQSAVPFTYRAQLDRLDALWRRVRQRPPQAPETLDSH